jgi:hypothetical protein
LNLGAVLELATVVVAVGVAVVGSAGFKVGPTLLS